MKGTLKKRFWDTCVRLGAPSKPCVTCPTHGTEADALSNREPQNPTLQSHSALCHLWNSSDVAAESMADSAGKAKLSEEEEKVFLTEESQL